MTAEPPAPGPAADDAADASVSAHRGGPSLPARLLAAADWFNDALIAGMAAAGWPLLNRTQSLVFVSIDDDGTRPAELARRLGITRQSMQELLAKLRDHELVTVEVDPADGRATIVRLAPRAHLLGRDAAIVSAHVERQLAARIGVDAVAALRSALALDWGSPPPAPTAQEIEDARAAGEPGPLGGPGAARDTQVT